MPVTVRVNGKSIVHKMSGGTSTATIPDVCKTPSPTGPVPVPYPNIAQSITLSNGTTTVKTDKAMAAVKGSTFALSNGDQAGTLGGVKSGVFMKEATWILFSFDVRINGRNACRFTDKMFHNAENCANLGGEIQQP
jgi:exopolysaccharide biosynthesis protein